MKNSVYEEHLRTSDDPISISSVQGKIREIPFCDFCSGIKKILVDLRICGFSEKNSVDRGDFFHWE